MDAQRLAQTRFSSALDAWQVGDDTGRVMEAAAGLVDTGAPGAPALRTLADPIGDGPTVVMPSLLTTIVIAVGFAATAALGVVPGPVLDLAATAGQFVR